VKLADLATPALVVDLATFEANVATMSQRWPGGRLRPHVKAFKSTALARRLAAAGHQNFCCATVRELEGMAAAGLGHDLLLANEVVGPSAERAGALRDRARITVAVDSAATIDAAAQAGIPEVLIDVDCGLARCGCAPGEAGHLADLARARGLRVRGIMAYEGHLMRTEKAAKDQQVAALGPGLRAVLDETRGDVISGGGTGTWLANDWATELQAGSYCLMDSEYVSHAPAFGPALLLQATVISCRPDRAVLDAGLKALGMDHGDPTVLGAGICASVSDEHTTITRDPLTALAVGDRVSLVPGHVDPTVAYHERMYVADGDDIVDIWPVDLRGW
jgi:D-threonine aldolase